MVAPHKLKHDYEQFQYLLDQELLPTTVSHTFSLSLSLSVSLVSLSLSHTLLFVTSLLSYPLLPPLPLSLSRQTASTLLLSNLQSVTDEVYKNVSHYTDLVPANIYWLLSTPQYRKVGAFVNKAVYLPELPRVKYALNPSLDYEQLENDYLNSYPGLLVLAIFNQIRTYYAEYDRP